MVKYYHLDSSDGNHSLIFKVITEGSEPGGDTYLGNAFLKRTDEVYFSYTERIWSSSNILQIPIKGTKNSPPEILMVSKHGSESFSPCSIEQSRIIWQSLRENGWNDSPY